MPDQGRDPTIILDLSRLLSRVMHATPTGVDRCEMAYARGLLAAAPERLRFAAVHPVLGVYGRLPRESVLRFLDATERRWGMERNLSRRALRRKALSTLWRLRPRVGQVGADRGRAIYIKASPNTLTEPAKIAAILRREGARFVCLLHDLIPLQYPEYARPDGARQHARRIDTIVTQADGILANSAATLDAILPHVARSRRSPALAFAHLGTEIDAGRPAAAPLAGRPYFVCIGTIEPRKNHLLLLNLWRQMSERHGCEAIPKLVIIGRRGWENEQVVDMLERCPALVGCVQELHGLPDRDVQRYLAGARALLLPSFAEGYGMPVSEALALGVPVVCSDLPALQEAGGAVPLYLDPLDGPAWARAIESLALPDSKIRVLQDQRRPDHAIPTWSEHIAILVDLLHRLAP